MIESILKPSANKINAMVELYDGSTLVTTCTCSDRLQDFGVERVGKNNKFFGFGIFQKITVHLIDLERNLTVSKGQIIKVGYIEGENKLYPYPKFYVTDVLRDENTNTLTVTAYDKLNANNNHVVTEVTAPYTVREYIEAAPGLLSVTSVQFVGIGTDETCLDTAFDTGANFEGTELYKDGLVAAAEVTQTIFYLDADENLIFKRLDMAGDAVLTITKNDYYDSETNEIIRLAEICSATELGDNVSATDGTGATQYVRDNPFWELRTDIAELVDNALAAIGGITSTPFWCDWDGNFLLEIGDKIALETEDGGLVTAYVLNDVIAFDGVLSEVTQWIYEEEVGETASNPTSLGDKLNQTFARVDKAAKEIVIVASEVDGHESRMSSLELTTTNISATVTSNKEELDEKVTNLNDDYAALSKEVSLKLSSEDVKIAIETELSNGVDKVTTSTGFTFDNTGLTVSKTDSEISTKITEDGMIISKSGQEVLVADNQGVRAEDLHATTYLIIGNNSRFEDWNGRTACFWIGGN